MLKFALVLCLAHIVLSTSTTELVCPLGYDSPCFEGSCYPGLCNATTGCIAPNTTCSTLDDCPAFFEDCRFGRCGFNQTCDSVTTGIVECGEQTCVPPANTTTVDTPSPTFTPTPTATPTPTNSSSAPEDPGISTLSWVALGIALGLVGCCCIIIIIFLRRYDEDDEEVRGFMFPVIE